jgi:hypothetical protein
MDRKETIHPPAKHREDEKEGRKANWEIISVCLHSW